MGEWADLIWFVVWAAVGLVALGLVIWVCWAVFIASQIKKTSKEFKGLDSDFFKSARRR